jgi:hypothetical protein
MPFDVAYTYTDPEEPTELDDIESRTSVDVHCYVEIYGPNQWDWFVFTDLEHKPTKENEDADIIDSLEWIDKNSLEYKSLYNDDTLEMWIDEDYIETYTIDGSSVIEGMMDILPPLVRKYLDGENGIVEVVGEMFLEYNKGTGFVWYDKWGDPEAFAWDEYPNFDRQKSIKRSAEHLKMRKIK